MRVPAAIPPALLLALAALGACRAPARGRAARPPATLAVAAPDTARVALSATSTLQVAPDSAGERRFHAVNRRYLLEGGSYADRGSAVFEETVDERCCWNAERSSRATVTLARWPLPLGLRTQPAWRTTVQADRGEFAGEFYRAVLEGCCDQTDALFFIDPLHGTVLFTHSREDTTGGDLPARVHHFPSATWRYVTFHDRYTESDPPEAKGEPRVVGVLQYGSADGPTSRALLVRPAGDALRYRLGRLALATATWEGRDLELPHEPRTARPPRAIGGFSIRVELVSEAVDSTWTVVVPVAGDALQLARATVPSDLRLRAAPAGRRLP